MNDWFWIVEKWMNIFASLLIPCSSKVLNISSELTFLTKSCFLDAVTLWEWSQQSAVVTSWSTEYERAACFYWNRCVCLLSIILKLNLCQMNSVICRIWSKLSNVKWHYLMCHCLEPTTVQATQMVLNACWPTCFWYLWRVNAPPENCRASECAAGWPPPCMELAEDISPCVPAESPVPRAGPDV